MVGNPACQIGWMSRFGDRLDLPLQGEAAEAVCSATDEVYRLDNGKVTLRDK